ncbi:MAG: N-6 DNA methylase, partial [Gemmatimonadetes bacterium]|nr:N-6 DNA methylase [Gemmatimonadota bacterium]
MLLDGGPGSFVLSATDERIWEDRIAADWSWSSNVPHHVTVTGNEVAVVRWDKAKRERLKRASVARQLNDFYRYLAADRVQSNQDVTNYMLRLFRRVRSLVAAAEMDDDQSIDAFLEFLACVIKQSGRSDKVIHGGVSLQTGGEDLLRSLSAPGVDKLLSEVISRPSSGSQPALIPSLAIRHAGSEIFQEAHFELLRASIPDLFGYTGPSRAKQVTRGGTHYTPPLLARTIAEQAFAQIPNLADRDRLTILDPACGSGSFLQEALRALRRCGFHGRLFLIGRDTSGPAISMARFVLTAATKDWSPGGGCETDIQQADSLAEALPPADVVVMNPPFVAWTALTMKQREQMRGILGSLQKGRSDLSMAFVSRALECLAPGGVLGTLLPASLLTLEAAEAWRRHLLDQGELAFIAALGDYGLFKYAQVQVAAAVFVVPHAGRGPREPVTALVATNDSGATGDALRALRVSATGRLGSDQMLPDKGWRLFQTSSGGFRRRGTWRLTPPQTEAALQDLLAIGRAVRIGDLFQVRQGVRTGLNTAFVLAAGEVAKLPRVEREWFRPAVMNVSIKDGQIEGRHRVFYPYDLRGLAIRDETQLRNVVPV